MDHHIASLLVMTNNTRGGVLLPPSPVWTWSSFRDDSKFKNARTTTAAQWRCGRARTSREAAGFRQGIEYQQTASHDARARRKASCVQCERLLAAEAAR